MKRGATFEKSVFVFNLLFILMIGPLTFAERMTLEAHNLVIEKLEASLKTIGSKDEGIDALGLKLQLANLYSDKARLLLIEEGNKGCQNCLDSKQTRLKAIRFYKEVQPKLQGHDFDQVSIQLAHLLESTNQNKDALVIYNNLINKNTAKPAILAQAYTKRAAALFSEAQFDKALSDYQKVLNLTANELKGPTLHKIAWAHFNKGDVDVAIKKLLTILKKEDYLKTPSEAGPEYSESFHSEVAHDLALFMARGEITENALNQLILVSPPEEVITNLLFLGDEAERLGQSQGAPLAWEKALKSEDFPKEKKLPVLISIARFHRDNLRFPKAKSYYTTALETAHSIYGDDFQTSKCVKACEEHRKALRQFLVQWDIQTRKLTKSDQLKNSRLALLEAHQIYHRFNDRDFETQLWLAQLALKLDQPNLARRSYARAADLLAETALTDSKSKALLSSALLEEIKVAESGANASESMAAYDHYLKLAPQGPASLQVRYQRAKLLYDQNNTKQAQSLFDEIVNDKTFSNKELKLKAAHLSLDALVLMKDIQTLESKSLEYSRQFPQQASEFHKISRKAGLELVDSLAKKEKSTSAAEAALEKLNTVTLNSSSEQDVHQYLRTKIDLALRAQRWDVAQLTISQFLQIRQLSEKDRQWALSEKLSLAELLLDFKTAYQTALQLNYLNSKKTKDLLKGSLLADLSNNDPKPWLERVVRLPQSTSQQVALARAQLVRLSKNNWKTLHQHARALSSQPKIFADLALESFNAEADFNEARWALAQPGVGRTWSGQVLQRLLNLSALQEKADKLRRQKLNSRTDALLASSLQSRIKDLAELKKYFKQAQKTQDWTLQVIAASLLKNENDRLAAEIELLPVPKTLKGNERAAYKAELYKEAQPFRKAGEELDSFLTESWKDDRYINALLIQIDDNPRIRGLLMNELRSLISFAPASTAGKIQDRLAELKNRPSQRDIISTRSQLRKDPLDSKLQTELLQMEKRSGNQSMVVFLQARGSSMKAGTL